MPPELQPKAPLHSEAQKFVQEVFTSLTQNFTIEDQNDMLVALLGDIRVLRENVINNINAEIKHSEEKIAQIENSINTLPS